MDGGAGPDQAAEQAGGTGGERDSEGLYLYGVARSRGWGAGGDPDALVKVRYRDLEALVRTAPYEVVPFDAAAVRDHHQRMEASLRRGTVLPAPFGLVFRGRRAVVRFLEDQYIVLDEGLAFLDGHWELRLHIHGEEDAQLREVATRLYSELRRFARAAIPLPGGGDRLLSAAFLVARSGWIEFVERGDDLGLSHPDLTFDLTGPWPPYDFVRLRL
jgi:hypothetical protein